VALPSADAPGARVLLFLGGELLRAAPGGRPAARLTVRVAE
jgi:hypothetical protein